MSIESDRHGAYQRWKWMQDLPDAGTEIVVDGETLKFTRTDYAVACFIAARVNAKNPTWPLYKSWAPKPNIAKKLNLDVRSVRRCIARLEAFGLIRVQRGGIFKTASGSKIKMSNLYSIRTPESDWQKRTLESEKTDSRVTL